MNNTIDCRAVKLRESVRFIDTETGKEQIKMMTTGYPVDPVTECVILVSGRRSKLFIDQEWDEAECAEEESEYYWLDTRVYRYKDFLIPNNKGGKFVKRYKPSIAKLVAERTGYKLTPVFWKGGESE